jgi:hypothetical protein
MPHCGRLRLTYLRRSISGRSSTICGVSPQHSLLIPSLQHGAFVCRLALLKLSKHVLIVPCGYEGGGTLLVTDIYRDRVPESNGWLVSCSLTEGRVCSLTLTLFRFWSPCPFSLHPALVCRIWAESHQSMQSLKPRPSSQSPPLHSFVFVAFSCSLLNKLLLSPSPCQSC